nr:hypothetical protein CFP56_35456 [Quercus suber]
MDHTSRSQSRPGSHISHDQETRNLSLEINHLCKKLHHRVHVKGDRTPLSSSEFDLEEDHSYSFKVVGVTSRQIRDKLYGHLTAGRNKTWRGCAIRPPKGDNIIHTKAPKCDEAFSAQTYQIWTNQ